jgi:hypothetical protein
MTGVLCHRGAGEAKGADSIVKQQALFLHPPLEGEGRPPSVSEGGRGGVIYDASIHPTPLAEFIIGPRFARTRWLATLPLQGRVKARKRHRPYC